MSLKKDLRIIAIALVPIAYLAYLWGDMPNRIPMHWNLQGEVDRYGEKYELIITTLFPIFVYLIFLIIPRIDPKKKLNQMGGKFQSLKFLLIAFSSLMALFIIYTAKTGSLTNANYILMLIGLLYIILGNYFKTIKANYFIGIKTPWTLENESVWKDTHILGGRLWFIGGIIIVLSSLVIGKQANLILFLIITAIIIITPVVYSYLKYQSLQESSK